MEIPPVPVVRYGWNIRVACHPAWGMMNLSEEAVEPTGVGKSAMISGCNLLQKADERCLNEVSE